MSIPLVVDRCKHDPYARNMETFGQRLRRLREERGISARQLALQVGLHPSYISLIENGKRAVDSTLKHRQMVAIAGVLGVSPDELDPGPSNQQIQEDEEAVPEIQRLPLPELLKRIGATPYRGRPLEDLAASAASRGSRIPQGYDEARPLKKRSRGDSSDHYQDIIIENECMIDLLYPGDIVTIDTRQSAQPNDVIVAVRFNDELLVKNLRVKDEHQYLESEDGKTIIPLDQYIRILGPVVSVQRSIWRMRR